MSNSENGRVSLKDLVQLAVPIMAAVAFTVGGWFFSSLYESVDELKVVVNRLGVLVEIANKQMESSKVEVRELKDALDRLKQEQTKNSVKIDSLRTEFNREMGRLDDKLEKMRKP